MIVELKYDKEYDEDVDEILSYISFPQTKNSKYVSGLLVSAGV